MPPWILRAPVPTLSPVRWHSPREGVSKGTRPRGAGEGGSLQDRLDPGAILAATAASHHLPNWLAGGTDAAAG